MGEISIREMRRLLSLSKAPASPSHADLRRKMRKTRTSSASLLREERDAR